MTRVTVRRVSEERGAPAPAFANDHAAPTPAEPPARLDRERILGAAERIVGSEGLSKLTMRRIGTELGVDPTAIYRHYRNKQAMLDALAERAFATGPELDPSQSWRDQMRGLVAHAFARYRAHPDLGILLARQPDTLPGLERLSEQILSLLIDGAGMELRAAAELSHQFENHVVGCGLFFAISEWHRDPRVTDRDALRRAYALLPADRYPHSSAAAPYLFADPDVMFDRTTELLLDVAERRSSGAEEG
jgi:AcrR family transcriptional regulator